MKNIRVSKDGFECDSQINTGFWFILIEIGDFGATQKWNNNSDVSKKLDKRVRDWRTNGSQDDIRIEKFFWDNEDIEGIWII